MKKRVRIAGLIGIIIVGFGIASVAPAGAQSAADKATARQLATEGIQFFQKERYSEALDKLERAESLFDAPVHLLYIARCYTKLNRLVEAAEAYRRLIRTELSAKAPQTFKEAVADGQRELPEVEPKIPTLRVDVTPADADADVKDLRLTIDGESVSTAIIGVDRPINPGTHVIEVSVAGQSPVSQRVDIAVAAKKVVKLELPRSVPGAPPNREPRAATSVTSEGPAASTDKLGHEPTSAATSPDKSTRRRIRILGGLDGAGTIPFGGKLDSKPGAGPADDRAVSGRFGIGGGAEARLGVSIPVGQLAMTPLLFINVFSHVPGSLYNASIDQSFNLRDQYDRTSVTKTVPTSAAFGIGLRFDTAPQVLQLGGFGEIGFLLRQAYATKITWTVQGTSAQPGNVCNFEEQFNGSGLRLRGGVMLPVASVVTLTASAGVGLVRVSQSGTSGKSCSAENALDGLAGERAEVPGAQRTIHAILGMNLGAEFGIGI